MNLTHGLSVNGEVGWRQIILVQFDLALPVFGVVEHDDGVSFSQGDRSVRRLLHLNLHIVILVPVL